MSCLNKYPKTLPLRRFASVFARVIVFAPRCINRLANISGSPQDVSQKRYTHKSPGYLSLDTDNRFQTDVMSYYTIKTATYTFFMSPIRENAHLSTLCEPVVQFGDIIITALFPSGL
jgi:hypothetical protein